MVYKKTRSDRVMKFRRSNTILTTIKMIIILILFNYLNVLGVKIGRMVYKHIRFGVQTFRFDLPSPFLFHTITMTNVIIFNESIKWLLLY